MLGRSIIKATYLLGRVMKRY